MIRLVLVDDHVLVREALVRFLTKFEDIEVVAETDNGLELINLLYANKLELIVMDIAMPGIDSFELTRRITANPQHPPILILSMHEDFVTVQRMFNLGVKGFISKNSNSDEFITAIRLVANGSKFIGTKLSQDLFINADHSSKQLKHDVLSIRELEVLKLLIKGKKVSKIADVLNLSIKTVSTHKTNIKKKMHLVNDAELIRYGVNNDIS